MIENISFKHGLKNKLCFKQFQTQTCPTASATEPGPCPVAPALKNYTYKKGKKLECWPAVKASNIFLCLLNLT